MISRLLLVATLVTSSSAVVTPDRSTVRARPCIKSLAVTPPRGQELLAQAQGPTPLVPEVLAGVAVALASIPTSVAFASIAGVEPLVGVWSFVVLGLVAPLLGGRPGVIMGAAGVVVVPLAPLIKAHGVKAMAPCLLVAAALEAAFGVLKLGKLIDLVSPAVMAGFLNGLGGLLGKSQLGVFSGAPAPRAALAVAAVCAALVQLLPMLTKAVPSSLAGLALASAAGAAARLPLATLASTAAPGTFAGGLSSLPSWSGLPDLSPRLLLAVLPTAGSIALICLLETLLAAKVMDDEAGPPAGGADPDRACTAMAAGTALSAALGGFGGCGLIPQTLLNLKSGGKGTASSVASAGAMALLIVALAPLVGRISRAALAGLMLTVAFGTVQWQPALKLLRGAAAKDDIPACAAMLVASVVCFKVDMAAGIVLGVAVERALQKVFSK